MSREPPRKSYFSRDPRNRHPDWSRPDYRDRERGRPLDRRSRSPPRDLGKRRSRSPLPRKDKDVIDENILSEISKLPEPSELWEGNQFQDASGYAPPPPSFSQEPVGNPAYGSAPSYQASYSGIYDDFPPVASIPTPRPPEISSWNQMSLPPPPTPAPPPTFLSSTEDQKKKEAAIESEMRHQKAALSKQREDYMKKASILKKELDTLKDQRNELRGDSKRSPSPDTKRFLKENTKLQLEIQNKLKTINNVVDMLNGIIGEEAQELPSDLDNSPDRSSKRKSRSPSAGQKYNYVYYDPEMHWCRVCNEFPPTAKDYLNHLHSAAHHKMAAAHLEAPWHTVSGLNEGFPNYASAPTKRTPIKGLQFFVPSTAWYCKLCDQFIGDLHCASAHLKSVTHSKNYTNFVEQNPHWETDWMSDRQKAFEKARASVKTKPPPEEKPGYTPHTIAFNKDGFHTKKKDSPPPTEEKKKKKEKKKKNKKKRNSSSSSSSSSSSDSEPVKKKKKKKDKKHSSDADDKNSLSQWVTSIHGDRLTENDLKLLDSLKNRIKMDKLAEEKLKSPDRSRERENAKRSRDNEHHEAREARNRDVRDRERDRDRERERELRDREREQRERDREREQREREREQRERERERERRARPSPPRTESKKPEIRKMPFIGKMPVYKSLGKTKAEEQKKEEEKKKEEDEANKKRREEMDAEIQKKVAEFKEKIAKAQLERAQQLDLPPPAVALPTALGQAAPPAFLPAPPAPAPAPVPPQPPPPATPAPAPALPKDFQDALEIIFPSSEAKPEMPQQELFSGFPPGFMPGIGMPSFPPFLQPQMPPQMVMGFDMNGPMFPGPRPPAPLFEQHQHLVGQKLRPTKNNNSNNNRGNNKHNPYQNKNQNQYRQNQNKNQNNQNQKGNHNQNQSQRNQQNQKQQQNQSNTKTQSNTKAPTPTKAETKANGDAAKKKEELDDLAMLGIDASDVGAGM